MIRCRHLAVVWFISGMALAARGEEFMFVFPLSPGQEVQNPAVVSNGQGSGHVMYDTITNLLEWSVSFQDLGSPVSMAHFHGPAAAGASASILLAMPTTAVTSGVLNGSGTWSEAHEQSLLNGLIYVNIHTGNYPSGEIRGQVVPEPATLILLTGAAGLFLRRRRP